MHKNLFLMLIAIPGILSLLPKLHQIYTTLIVQNTTPIPLYERFIIISLSQISLLTIAAIFLGNWATKKIDWHDDILNAIENNNIAKLTQSFYKKLLPSLRYTIPASFGFVAILYTFVLPLLPQNLIVQLTDFSTSALIARILYGGIVEEILLRWCVLSLFVFLGLKFFKQTQLTWVIAIFISAFLFGCGHVPSVLALIQPTYFLIFLIIGINMLAGVFFGWIFKQFGLIAAMLAHIMFHVTWFAIAKILIFL